jgi:hypothetical protein
MAHGPIPDKPAPRCNAFLGDGGPDDPRCALSEGHNGTHTPLPTLSQMARYKDGPWCPNGAASQRLRDQFPTQQAP